MTEKTTTDKGTATLQLSAAGASAGMPTAIAVGDIEFTLLSGPMGSAERGIKRYAARWSKGSSGADAGIEIRRTARTTSELTVTLERPKGAQGFLWPKPALRRIEDLLAQALAYEIETRSIEEGTAFIRRTTPELVRSRAS
jgi:hypothetical protein